MRNLPRAPKGAPAREVAQQADPVETTQAPEGQRQRAEQLLEFIERRKDRPTDDFYGLGEALRELQRGRLYIALGHTSFAEMLRARRIMGLTQAKELIESVSGLLPEPAMALGTEQTSALPHHAAAAPDDSPRSLPDATAARSGERVPETSARELPRVAGNMRMKAMARGPKPRLAGEREAMQAARSLSDIPSADAEGSLEEEREAMEAARALQAWLRQRGAEDAIAVAHKGKAGWCLQVELKVDHVERLIGEE